jgi:Ala-tRNA(Pro) deacylase
MSHAPSTTAEETAQAAHVSGKRFAKVVLLRRDDSDTYMLAVLPASEQVDLARLADLMDERVSIAAEVDFGSLFPDCELGAAPPFGDLAGIPVIVDTCLERNDAIVFNGGTHTDLIEMSWPDFVRLASPRIYDCGRPYFS